MKETKNVADIITSLIIEKLEEGTVPWRKPWRCGIPRNLVTGKPYRGVNAFLLGCTGSSWFATYKQVIEKGGAVKSGTKSLPVVFWHMNVVIDPENGNEKTIPILRYYRVFSADDIEGIELPSQDVVTRDYTPIEAAERIINNMPQRPEIWSGAPRAYYSPALDYINMPKRELFESDEGWYSTLFHECAHATGHASRLNRSTVANAASFFGSTDYSKEELIAECGAAFLAAESGIVAATIDNSAAYIAGWLRALKAKDNRGMVIHAAAAGQRAADYILNRQQRDGCA